MFDRFGKVVTPVAISWIFAALMFAFAVVGVWLRFSPIPYWDMWDGTLGFIIDQRAGLIEEWWGQHNEHRVILARILFYLDYNFFGGQNRLLIPLNIVIATVSALVMFLFVKQLQAETDSKAQSFRIVAILIAGFLFSWTQQDNFTWGFQSQFFLAQLLPLIALYFIARSSETQSAVYFCFALLMGVLSAGTMANGILIMPIMFIFLLVIWQGVARAACVLVLAVILPTVYFSNYVAIAGHGSISDALLNDPLNLLYYTLIYIGSPFYYLTGQLSGSRNVAALAGFVLVCFCLVMSFRQIMSPKRSPYIVALLCFLLYIGATAFGTAGGRLSLGIGGATSSRYATPAIMAWAAFTLAMMASFPQPAKFVRVSLLSGTVFACILALGYQFQALAPQQERLFGRELAILALELGVRDEPAIGATYPSADYALELSGRAKEQGLSVFGVYPYEGISESQGETLLLSAAPTCIGSLDETITIEGEDSYSRVRGWIFDPASRDTPQVLTFTDENGLIIGSGLTGQPRPDVRDAVDGRAYTSGFGGYIGLVEPGTSISIYGDDPLCRMELAVPG